MLGNQSTVDHALLMHMSTSLSVVEILLPRYINWSDNFGSLPVREEIAPSSLKDMNSVISVFT